MTHTTTAGRRLGSRAIGLVALLALSLALCAMLANTASASLGNLQRISATSASSSTSVKTVFAYCPYRTAVLGTAAKVTGGGGQVVLEDVVPDAQLGSVKVTAHEGSYGSDASWSVTATAICGWTPGLERVSTTLQRLSYSGNMDVHAQCPAGKKVLGVGAENTGDAQHSAAISTMWALRDPLGSPTAPPDRTYVYAGGGGIAQLFVTAHAVCADPPSGLDVSVTDGQVDSTAQKSTSTYCSDGKRVTGSGIWTGSHEDPAPWPIVPTDIGSIPSGAPIAGSEGATASATEGPYGFSPGWFVDSLAICASP